MRGRVKSKDALAYCMDDELKLLEIRYYGLTGEDAPKLRYGQHQCRYHGPISRPIPAVYSKVAAAYSTGKVEHQRAQAVEDLVMRYERFSGEHAPAKLLTAVMKAWLVVDDLEKADQWLAEMESRYAKSQNQADAPNTAAYNTYIDRIRKSRRLAPNAIRTKCTAVLDQMRRQYLTGENPWAFPDRSTYQSLMICYAHGSRGSAAFDEVHEIYNRLNEDYLKTGSERLKPTAVSTIPLFNAASHCADNRTATELVETLLEDLQSKFKATGDPDHRPVDGVYSSLLTLYGKVSKGAAKGNLDRVDRALLSMKENGVHPTDHTLTSGKPKVVVSEVIDYTSCSVDC